MDSDILDHLKLKGSIHSQISDTLQTAHNAFKASKIEKMKNELNGRIQHKTSPNSDLVQNGHAMKPSEDEPNEEETPETEEEMWKRRMTPEEIAKHAHVEEWLASPIPEPVVDSMATINARAS